jgi:GT2 family glycosyltransferase
MQTPSPTSRTSDDRPQPQVSVVIPTRNRRELLTLALASALGQRGVDVEAIVIDEGSTDETPAMLASLGDPRVRVIRHEVALGKSAARNRGIAEARGEWVAFLDDDDLWAPDKLHRQLEALQASGRRWAYTGAVNITEDHRIIGGAPPRSAEEVSEGLPRVNAVPGGCSSVIVHRSALSPHGFDGSYRLCEDWDLWIRLARGGPAAAVTDPLVAYRIHSGNSSADTRRLVEELEMIEQRYGGPVERVLFYRHVAQVSLRVNRPLAALGYYARAAASDARGYAVRQFVPDALRVFRTVGGRLLRRLGRPPRASKPLRDVHAEWRERGRVWLVEFLRRHADTHGPLANGGSTPPQSQGRGARG